MDSWWQYPFNYWPCISIWQLNPSSTCRGSQWIFRILRCSASFGGGWLLTMEDQLSSWRWHKVCINNHSNHHLYVNLALISLVLGQSLSISPPAMIPMHVSPLPLLPLHLQQPCFMIACLVPPCLPALISLVMMANLFTELIPQAAPYMVLPHLSACSVPPPSALWSSLCNKGSAPTLCLILSYHNIYTHTHPSLIPLSWFTLI